MRIRRGIDLRYEGAPRQSISEGPALEAVAVLGDDYPGIRLDVLVESGAEVAAGQPILRDRKHPDRSIVAPVSGRVSTVTRGARRMVGLIEISPEGDAAVSFPVPASLEADSLGRLLLASGLWATIRARPFGRPADLFRPPEAIFITAMDTRPHAPDPAVVISGHAGWFRRGAEALALLTPGKTYLCHAAGDGIPAADGVTTAAFSGHHPAGLPSTHIHHLHPLARSPHPVWQVGYQDVIALGHLLATGQVWTDRIVAVSGTGVSSQGLLRTRPGANLHQLVRGQLVAGGVSLHSGSPLDGRVQAFLSREHLQVFADQHRNPAARPDGLPHRIQKLLQTGIPAVIPNAMHERAAPIGILPIPFLRALSVGDVDTARMLGALELVEEDMALLSHVDGTETDFGLMLRQVLDELEEAA